MGRPFHLAERRSYGARSGASHRATCSHPVQVNSSHAVHADAVYVGSVDGSLYALEAGNGRLRWKFRSGGPIISSPAIVNGVVYFGSTDHHIYALAA